MGGKTINAILGVDFGAAHTGIALVAEKSGKVLDAAVIEHRAKLKETLDERRANRAMRRRRRGQRQRLRDFRALLKGMRLPQEEAQKNPARGKAKMRPQDNPLWVRLMGEARHRGWDYAQISELVLGVEDPNEEPQKTNTDNSVARMLIVDFNAPAKSASAPRKGKKSEAQFQEVLAAWQKAAEEYPQKRADKQWRKENANWLVLQTPCLSAAVDIWKAADGLEKKAEAKGKDAAGLRAQAEKKWQEYERETKCLFDEESKEADIKKWLENRAAEALGAAGKGQAKKAAEKIMKILELTEIDREQFFSEQEGRQYRPHRNRHRDKAKEKFCALMEQALARDEVKQQAAAVGKKRGESAAAVLAKWRKEAVEIVINREYRQKKFQNRAIGKCPAVNEDGARCGKNVPSRRPDVRALLFEEKARMLTIADDSSEDGRRKLSEAEIDELKTAADFESGRVDDKKWRAAVKKLSPRKWETEEGGKKDGADQLRDIVEKKGGRIALCARHLREKIQLLKDGETESEAWARLHQRRALNAADVAPSFRQKVQRVRIEAQKMAKENDARIVRAVVESARFDIEDKKKKKGQMGRAPAKRRKNKKDEAAKNQNDRCLYCGDYLRGGLHLDHILARARGAGNAQDALVAACAECNINKGKRNAFFNEEVMEAIRGSNEKLWKKLQEIKKTGTLESKNFRSQQATMVCGHALRGELAEKFNLTPPKGKDESYCLPPVDGRATNTLRRLWYRRMHRQKRALRGGAAAVVEKKFSIPCEMKDWDGQKIKVVDAPSWLQQTEKAWEGTPAEKNIGDFEVKCERDDGSNVEKYFVVLRKDDPIRIFHHALDAVILAARIDYRKIARQPREGREQWLARFAKDQPAPDLTPLGAEKQGGEFCAPNLKKRGRLIEDKRRKDKWCVSKTDREAVAIRGELIYKRKPLDKMKEGDVENILPGARKIKEALQKAWREFNENEDLKKDFVTKDGLINPAWFLQLSESHILHPKNTRAAPIKHKKGAVSSYFGLRRPKIRGGKKIGEAEFHTHYFYRANIWNKVHLVDKEIYRETERFYWKHGDNARWENGKKPPRAADAIFAKGDRVRAKNGKSFRGVWIIAELGDKSKGAILRPDPKCPEARAGKAGKKCVYWGLEKVKKR